MKGIASILSIVALTGCGGGGEGEVGDYFYDTFSFDEYSRSTEFYTPPSIQIGFFPLAVHFRTITKSYVGKVGTTANRHYRISGRMTTSSVNSGVYEANLKTTVKYQGTALFEGLSVTPVVFENHRNSIIFNGLSQADEKSTSTSYYDTSFGIRVGSLRSDYYKVLDKDASAPLPEYAVTGAKGDYFVYLIYSDSSKSNLIGRDVLGYNILSTSLGSSGQFKARVEYSIRSYSRSNQLLGVQTSTDEVVFSTTLGAGSTNLSLYVDDVSGSTTSRLLFTRIQ
jgi:hypothetical protein